MNLGNIFETKLKEQSEKFVKWATLATDMLKNSKELKSDVMSLNELDVALDDLKKVSEPESQDDYTVEELLEVNFKVITRSGKERIISYKDIKNAKNTMIEMSRGLNEGSPCKMSFRTQCDSFNLRID